MSIGVTVDSYVVYFERLKDDVRLGRTLRSSAERSFRGAYRTILAADVASLIGAALLWYFTVGSVRGFAFFLGLSTVARHDRVVLLHAAGGDPHEPQQGVRRARRARRRTAARRGHPTTSRWWGRRDDRSRHLVPSTEPAPSRAGRRAVCFTACTTARPTSTSSGKRRIGFAISGALILISLLSLFTRGLNLGIDFEGGVAWEFPAANTSVEQTRSSSTSSASSDAKIQTLRGADGERIRAQAGPQTGSTASGVRQTLAENAKVDIGEVQLHVGRPVVG